MSSLDVIHKLRQRLHATAAAKPNQWHTGVAMLRFLALMLLLTLLVRGTAATAALMRFRPKCGHSSG